MYNLSPLHCTEILSEFELEIGVIQSTICSSYLFDTFIRRCFSSTVGSSAVLVNLILVTAIDPGIIPRSTEQQSSVEDIGSSSKKVSVNGVELKLKYCRICRIFRPPRSCHCAVCDNCVENFDHHCPWIGQCIALRNYRFYLTFLIIALVFFVYIFGFSCRRIGERMSESGFGLFGMLRSFPETLALTLFSFAAIWFLGCLAIFHSYLTAINQTAYENFRNQYEGSPNPYDKGIISNIKEVVFAPLPPSKVDFRTEVMPRRNTEDHENPPHWPSI
ncbi:hypothetical protein V6N12_056434 [Hibiscus sabdariffa]|uniref:S-acyltransferase n=1 Tax=Hibiscus sabdariffa TaxID=183260 RepID=A0ABR2CT92_9ROSI